MDPKKRDHNFDNHPIWFSVHVFRLVGGLRVFCLVAVWIYTLHFLG